MQLRFLRGLLECNMSAALAEARRLDEFDELFPQRSGALFESEESAGGCARVGLASVFHASASKCELFENSFYHSEMTTLLCVALNVLPESQLSLERVLSVLAKCSKGPCMDVMIAVVRNCPDRLDLAIKSLLGFGPVLNKIAEQSPLCALRVRDALVEAQVLPDLAMHLTLHAVRDGLSFCGLTLRGEASWIRGYFQLTQEKENTPAARMRGFLLHLVEEPEFQQSPRRLGQLLLLLNGVCGMWGLRVSSGSSQRIVTAMMNRARESALVAEQGLCFLLVCEGLAKLLPPQLLSDCLKVLLQSAAAPLVTLAAVRFTGKAQLPLNAAWAKQTAGVPVSIHGESLQMMGAAWRDALSDSVMAAHAAMLPTVASLCRSSAEPGPALAMKECLASQLLLRTRVDCAAGWLARQIANLALPLHPVVLELVAEFVSCCVVLGSSPLSPLSVEQMTALQRQGSVVSKLVAVFLALSHNAAIKHLGDKTRATPYSLDLIEGFKIKRLLSLASSSDFGALPEKVLLLCVTDHPEMIADQKGFQLREGPLVASWMEDRLSDEHREIVALSRLSDDRLCDDEGVQQVLFVQLLPSLSDRNAILAFSKIWYRMHNLMPVAISVATVKALARPHGSTNVISSAALIKDPLLILSVIEPNVFFKFAPILLEVLSVYASASRKAIMSAESDKELRVRLATVQDAAIAQLMIELLVSANAVLDVQIVICAFLHQLLLENPSVLSLIHHQRYPVAGVSILVEHIPSLHVVLDMLPELLESQRDWSLLLASYLLPKYATPKSLSLARLIFQSLLKASQTAPRETLKFVKVTKKTSEKKFRFDRFFFVF